MLRWSTAELDGPGDGSTVLVRRGDGPGSVVLDTDREVVADGKPTVTGTGAGRLVRWPAGTAGDRLTIRLSGSKA